MTLSIMRASEPSFTAMPMPHFSRLLATISKLLFSPLINTCQMHQIFYYFGCRLEKNSYQSRHLNQAQCQCLKMYFLLFLHLCCPHQLHRSKCLQNYCFVKSLSHA